MTANPSPHATIQTIYDIILVMSKPLGGYVTKLRMDTTDHSLSSSETLKGHLRLGKGVYIFLVVGVRFRLLMLVLRGHPHASCLDWARGDGRTIKLYL